MIILDHPEVVTEEARRTRHEIISRLGMTPMTDEAADEASRTLDAILFSEVQLILARRRPVGPFVNPHSNQMTALALLHPEIGVLVDRQYTSFIFELSINIVVVAFRDRLDDEMVHRFRYMFKSLGNPALFETELELKAAFFRTHADLMPVASAFARAMFAFIVCHEIAHHQLGHLAKAARREHEEQADRLGYNYFRRLVARRDRTEHLRLTPNLLALPCLFFKAYESWETWRGVRLASELYPPMFERRLRLEQRFSSGWPAEALHIYSGGCAALDEISEVLKDSR